jgi:ATP-binding cassette, subfamily B, bacterial PglK
LISYFKKILVLIGSAKRKLPALLILFLCASLMDLVSLGLIGPYIALLFDSQPMESVFIKEILSFFSLPSDRGALIFILSSFLFLLFFLKAILAIWVQYKILQFGQSRQVFLRSYLMKSYQNLPYYKYLDRNSNEYIYNIHTLVDMFTFQVIIPGLKTASDLIVAIAILLFLAWQNFIAFSILFLLVGGVLLGYDKFFRNKARNYGEQANIAATSILKGVSESLEGFKEIRILGKQKFFYDKVVRACKTHSKTLTKNLIILTAPRYLMEFLVVGFIVLIVVFFQLSANNLNDVLPIVGVFSVAALRLLPSAYALSSNILQIRFHKDGVNRLYKDYLYLEDAKKSSLSTEYEEDEVEFSSLELKNIGFSYENSNIKTLKNISLKIKAGDFIGIIGSSGSGKTTLIDVLLGLLEPSSGKVLFNQINLSHQDVSLKNQVAYLTQQTYLIDDTLKNNVAIGEEYQEIDTNLVIDSLKKANLDDFVKNLPHGIDTMIGERGIKISGGQRQRIALARAFYYGRSVLIMDEATSSLDSETEHRIIEELEALHGKQTMILITHSMSTVRHCDYIFRLENGSIVESGRPKDILK